MTAGVIADARDRPDARARARAVEALVWGLPGVLTLVAALALLDRRSLWQDELATLSATSRPFPDMLRLLTHSDAVLAPYYTLLHGWVRVAGESPVALRLPSALAMAAAVAVGARCARVLLGRAAGLATGLVLLATPSTLLYAMQARAYALTALLATLATAAFVAVLTRPDRRRWLAYAVVVACLGLTQVTALSLVAAHAAVVLALPRLWPDRDAAAVRRGLALACVPALLAAAPLLLAGHLQSRQIAWIPRPGPGTIALLPAEVSGVRVLGAWWIAIAACAVAAVTIRARGRQRGGGESEAGAEAADAVPVGVAVLLGLAVALVPVLVIGVVSLVTPVSLARYLLFTSWGWAFLVGGVLAHVTRQGVRQGSRAARIVPATTVAVVLGVGAVLGVPGWREVGARTLLAQPDFRLLAAPLREHARPGDAIVVPTARGKRFRVGLKAYLDGAAWPEDVLVREDAVAAESLDAHECEPATCLGRPARLWVACYGGCGDPLSGLSPPTRAVIRHEGYRAVQRWRGGNAAITLMVAPD
ncbi:MAG: glycosyltransferase family 39 protein [Kineosporiaceae bacterium]